MVLVSFVCLHLHHYWLMTSPWMFPLLCIKCGLLIVETTSTNGRSRCMSCTSVYFSLPSRSCSLLYGIATGTLFVLTITSASRHNHRYWMLTSPWMFPLLCIKSGLLIVETTSTNGRSSCTRCTGVYLSLPMRYCWGEWLQLTITFQNN